MKVKPAIYRKSWNNAVFDVVLWLPAFFAVVSIAKIIYQRHFNNIILLNKFLEKFKFVNLAFVVISSLLVSLKIIQIIIQKNISKKMLPNSARIQKSYLKEYVKSLEVASPSNIRTIKVKAYDGIELDTLEINHCVGLNKIVCEQKYLINFCGSGTTFQEAYKYHSMIQVTDQMEIDKVIYFNYRGTGNSIGNAQSYIDLVNDGIAQIEYLHVEQQIQYENIHLYGHSMGGGIATKVAMHYQKQGIQLGSLLVDRTYGDIIHTAESIAKKTCKPIVPLIRSIVSNAKWDINIIDDFINFKSNKLCIALKNDGNLQKGCLNKALSKLNQDEDQPIIVIDYAGNGHTLSISGLWHNNLCKRNGRDIDLHVALQEHFTFTK